MSSAGILMPVSSLPSHHGIGDFGEDCFLFLDYVEKSGLKIWQILPINPLGYGNSPYQPYSSFAGDEIYINLNTLTLEGLLTEIPDFQNKAKRVDYEKVRKFKEFYLKQAFKKFIPSIEYFEFIEQPWVEQYGIYITLKKKNGMCGWNEWSEIEKNYLNEKKLDISKYKEDITYEMFIQYIFYRQWMKVKKYANEKGIQIIGDVPFYVGIDSLDVWANKEYFLLEADGKPTFIAGVPPDYFSATGQRWGNPIYDWEKMSETKYKFWIERLSYTQKLFDVIRIDHFRAFDTYWKIPSSCPTAIEGAWFETPGEDFFHTLIKEIPEINIIVEDLGDLTKGVHKLRDDFGFKGMKVLQFAFDPMETNNDFPDRENMLIYTGTHDNQTILGWYTSQSKKLQKAIIKQLVSSGYDSDEISWRFISMALYSVADIAIIPMQDFLGLNDNARFNTPGTVGSPNWEWKLADFKQFKLMINKINNLIKMSKRA